MERGREIEIETELMVKLKGQIGDEDKKIKCKNMQSKERSQERSERMQGWEKVLAAR